MKVGELISKIQLPKSEKATAVALDVGKDSIKLIELVREDQMLKLSKIDLVKMPSVRTAGPEQVEVLKNLIVNLLTKNQIKQKDVVLGISGQSVFIKFLEILPVAREKLEQTIKYEAQQQIPFSLNEVEWDAYLFERMQEEEASAYRVLLVAIKKDNLASTIDLAEKAGLRPSILDISTLAVYNCVKFNQDYDENKFTLVINTGAQSTDLLVLQGEDLWMRNFAIGGDNITATLEKKFNISFADAQELKQRASIDKTDIKEAIGPVLEDLHAEITRSIEYYYFQQGRSQEGTSPLKAKGSNARSRIDTILLSGGGFLMAGVDKLLAERFSCEVRRLEPFKMLQLDDEIKNKPDLKNKILFSQAVGLALRGLSMACIKINLLKEQIKARNLLYQKAAYGVGSLVLAVVILFTASTFMRRDYRDKNLRLRRLRDSLKIFSTYQPQIEELQKKKELLCKRINILGDLTANRALWFEALSQLQGMLPAELWLTGFSGTTLFNVADKNFESSLDLQGRAASYEGINDFVSELKSSTLFAEVKPLSSSFIEEEANGKDRVEVVKFSISMKVVPRQIRNE